MERKTKPKKCKVCTKEFYPARPMQTVCTPLCAMSHARKMTERSQEVLKKAERIADKAKREALKSRSEWMKEAQTAFNAYIRERDRDAPCISCGRFHDGQWHAGHYLSTGARPELRFEPMNVHKQCQPCNTHLHGNLVLYRVNLIQKIGLDRVEWLEGPHEPLKLTVEAIKALRDEYRAKTRALQREKETA